MSNGPLLVEVTIPSIGADPLIVEINNDRYSYRAGETYEVTEDVAEVIENMIASFPQEGTPNIPVVAPKVTEEDIGKAVVVGEDGNFTFGEAGGGSGDVVFEITNLTMSPQGSNFAITSATINTTWSELTSAINNGKRVIFHTTVSAGVGNNIVLETGITAVNYYDGAATQIVTGAILDYSLMPAAAEMHLYEHTLEEDAVGIEGWLIPLITE